MDKRKCQQTLLERKQFTGRLAFTCYLPTVDPGLSRRETGFYDSLRVEGNANKFHKLTTCSWCNGKVFLPVSVEKDWQGRLYVLYALALWLKKLLIVQPTHHLPAIHMYDRRFFFTGSILLRAAFVEPAAR